MEENFDNKLKSECNEIKEQINPPQELINRTILKVREVEQERRYRGKKSTLLLSKIVAMFVTAVVLVEGATFAFKKQDILSLLFSNVDKGIETAIEYGNVHNVDMDYIDVDGLRFKVEFVLMNEYNFDLVLKFDNLDEYANANGIVEVKEVLLVEPVVKGNNDIILYADTLSLSNFKSQQCVEVEDKHYIILHGYNIENRFPIEDIEKLDIERIKINLFNKEENNKYIEYNEKIEIDIKNVNIDNVKTNYKLDDNRIEKYNIVLSSTNLKVELYFKEDIVKDIDVEKTYLKNNFGKKYFCNKEYTYYENYLSLTFPISDYQEIDNLKVNLNLNNKNLNIKMIKGN